MALGDAEAEEHIKANAKRLTPRIVDAIISDWTDPPEIKKFIEHVASTAIDLTIGNLHDEGYCSYDFHLNICEFAEDTGKCEMCGKRRTAHRLVYVCERFAEETDGETFIGGDSSLPDGPCRQCETRAFDLAEREKKLRPCNKCAEYEREREALHGRLTESLHRRLLQEMGGDRSPGAPARAAARLAEKPGGTLPVDEWRRELAESVINWTEGKGQPDLAEYQALAERFFQLVDIIDPPQARQARQTGGST